MTTNLQDLFKSMQIQNQTVQSTLGLNTFQAIAKALENQNKIQLNLSGMSGLKDIAKSISQQVKPFHTASAILGSNLQAQISAFQYPKNHSALFGLNSTLVELAKTNQLASERLSSFATSQILLSNNLALFAKTLNQSHLSKFNSIDIALQGLSKAYLKSVTLSQNWQDISVAEEANETISNITNEILNNNTIVSVQDLVNFRQSIVAELFVLLGKTKTDKARQLIFEIIAVISFLLIFYNPFTISTDKTNKEVIEEVKKGIERTNIIQIEQINTKLRQLSNTRIARINVDLKYSEKKKSKIIGIVKVGQQITVIEIRRKYLLISYIDKDTQEPKSGFVVKKYFDVEK